MTADDEHRAIQELLATLIGIPSVNPAYDPASAGENAVGDELARRGAAAGLLVERSDVIDGRRNVTLRLPAPQPRISVLIEGHLDTVGLPAGRQRPVARVEGGRIHGRGACDVKGGIAAAYTAVERLAREGALRHVDLSLLLAVDEEHAFRGITHRLATGAAPDLAIVLEPTELRIVTRHHGVIRFEADVPGVSAHTSRGDGGRNAIVGALRMIDDLERWHAARAAAGSVLTVATIRGGSAMNVVPDSCTVGVEVRTAPADDPAAVLAEIRALLPGEIVVRELLADGGLLSAPDGPLPRALGAALREQGLDPRPAGVRFGTDASKLGRAGVPAVVFGPGSIDQAHADDEWVELGDVVRASRALHAALRHLDDAAGAAG
ncbi:M20 family metallopeptidase [Jiangella muralis]|uniref:M20 family metallopeptidase n=1 Tax=Jiangella muralis TaxID=702383 RepID=UPI00069FBDB9|nr:M20/M25/M40 family metallo-hydrolase [Jiangella muralis]